MAQLAASSEIDREYLVRRQMSKGYQVASLVAPPLYTAMVFARRRTGGLPWSLNRMLRATWVLGVAGIAQAGAFEYLRTSYEDDYALRTRRITAMYNRSSLRADDHSTIGAILGAVLTPAILWKRARTIHLFLGGAGIGAGAGLITHWIRYATGDRPTETVPPIAAPVPSSPTSTH